MHALIVRPVEDYYQIVAGHHRKAGAERAGLTAVPCWMKEMGDEEAFMLLVLSNAQSELSNLEIGIHALEYVEVMEVGKNNKNGLSEYARRVGKTQPNISLYRQSAIVLKAIEGPYTSKAMLLDKAMHLGIIHRADPSAWSLLVEHLLSEQWSVVDIEKVVKRVKETLAAIPAWWTVNRLAIASLAIENKAQGLKGVFELAGALADKLGVVTIYRHEESGATEVREGREYQRFDPVAEEHNANAEISQSSSHNIL
jgi:ParB-like chromosome segregation protein Spo0J